MTTAVEEGIHPWPAHHLPLILERIARLGGQDTGLAPIDRSGVRDGVLPFETYLEHLVKLGLIEIRLSPEGVQKLIDCVFPPDGSKPTAVFAEQAARIRGRLEQPK